MLATVLLLFQIVLLARVVVDWLSVLGGENRALSTARRLTHSVTEPVIAPVRRILPPVRLGSVAIDLAFIVVFVAVLVLRSVALSL
nr:YggT family protein [Pseudonocardia acidicola]